jgi:hypothetical protein
VCHGWIDFPVIYTDETTTIQRVMAYIQLIYMNSFNWIGYWQVKNRENTTSGSLYIKWRKKIPLKHFLLDKFLAPL